jgi:hypothetical protein
VNFVEACVTFWSIVFKDYSFPLGKKQFVPEKKCIVSSIFYENGNIFVNAVHITQAQPFKKRLCITSQKPINSYS